MKKSTILTSLGITIIAILTYLGYLFFVEGTYVPTDTIGIQEIEVLDEQIVIKGYTTGSGNGFSKYKYFIEDGSLYIKLKYSLVSKFNPVGDFMITITESTNDIQKVHIQGKDKHDNRIVWESK